MDARDATDEAGPPAGLGPSGEIERAIRALALGVVLGLVLRLLARR